MSLNILEQKTPTFWYSLLSLGVEHEVQPREGGVPGQGGSQSAVEPPYSLGSPDGAQGPQHALVTKHSRLESEII